MAPGAVRVPIHDAGRPRRPRRRSSQRASTSSSCRDQSPDGDRSRPSSPPRHPGAMGPRTPCHRSTRAGSAMSGVEALKRFVHDGGTLVTLDEASDLAARALRRRVRAHSRRHARARSLGVLLPGICAADRRRHQPAGGLGDGARDAPPISRARAPSTRPIRRCGALRSYAPADVVLMSGWLLGADRIATRHAAARRTISAPAVSSSSPSRPSSARSRTLPSSCSSTRSTEG